MGLSGWIAESTLWLAEGQYPSENLLGLAQKNLKMAGTYMVRAKMTDK